MQSRDHHDQLPTFLFRIFVSQLLHLFRCKSFSSWAVMRFHNTTVRWTEAIPIGNNVLLVSITFVLRYIVLNCEITISVENSRQYFVEPVLKSPENPNTTILHSEGCRSSFRIRPENIVEFYFRLIIMPITHQSGWSSWYGLSKRMGGGVLKCVTN